MCGRKREREREGQCIHVQYIINPVYVHMYMYKDKIKMRAVWEWMLKSTLLVVGMSFLEASLPVP